MTDMDEIRRELYHHAEQRSLLLSDVRDGFNRLESRLDNTDSEIKALRIDMNGRIRKLELAGATLRGALLTWRVAPVLIALAGIIIAGYAVLG